MKKSLASRFCCPACRSPVEAITQQGDDEHLIYGLLACYRCYTGTPVLAGFVHIDQPQLLDHILSLEELQALEHKITPRLARYGEVLQQSASRSYDTYAAFQPFNESTRALYPLLDTLRQQLNPGDVILDTWCRTGFNGALLAGLFPEQQIISIWEGNSGVLAYEGYRYWLGQDQRPSNWTIVFTHPSSGLPFLDESIDLLHGLDSMHRYSFSPFLGDCLRVVKKTGALVFPHIHLSNSEPEPFFQRGGVQLHGQRYRAYFDKVLACSGRQAFVLSELDLFNIRTETRLKDQADTAHYNGFIAVLPAGVEPLLHPTLPKIRDEDCLLPNPLLEIDPRTGRVRVDGERMSSGAAEMLARHPCYDQHLQQVLPAALSKRQAMIWHWLQTGATWGETQAKLQLSPAEAQAELDLLVQSDIVQAVPIGEAMSRLQHFYVNRCTSTALSQQCFTALWQGIAAAYADRDLLRSEDGSAFNAADSSHVVSALTALLAAREIGSGSRVALIAAPLALAILFIWACWLRGAVVVPIDPALPKNTQSALLQRANVKLVLSDDAAETAENAVYLGEAETTLPSLFDLLPEFLDAEPALIPVGEQAPASLLFTSGTTGIPKGVILSHGALYRGARTLSESYEWHNEDIILCPAGLHTMSGLRNNCVAPLMAGATLFTADVQHFRHPGTAAAACRRWNISVLTMVPAFIHMLRAAGTEQAWGPLRQVLCTGTQLSLQAQAEGEKLLSVPVYNYYGLTESGGICTLQALNTPRFADGDIGAPAAAELRLIDEHGQVVSADDQPGELEIYNANLLLAYLDCAPETGTRIVDGWLRTGDRAYLHQGHFILCGRSDDMIKTRLGEMLNPSVIESWLCGRDDILEAAVIAAETSKGTRLEGWIIPRGEMSLEQLAVIRAELLQALGAAKTPDRLHLATDLPRGANGKVARAVLRQRLNEGRL